ncbi:hypothetical protein PQX77_022239 [Marasmius sp. AFHP31]|nr:hypothetical protein PQX77_022239 [Marasmius sp. AFHP31]
MALAGEVGGDEEVHTAGLSDTEPSNNREKPKKSSVSTKAQPFVAKKRRIGVREQPVFPDILLQYANWNEKQAPPLPIFLNKNLQKLNHQTAPALQKAPTTSGSKEWMLDLDDFCTKEKIPYKDKPKEDREVLKLTYNKWQGAMENWQAFEEKRDLDGIKGEYATFALEHFGYFEAQKDKVELYECWKEMKWELRVQRFENCTEFDVNNYETRMGLIRMEYRLEKKRQEEERKKKQEEEEREAKRRRLNESSRASSSGRFRAGNQDEKKSSALPCRLACGARGHCANQHGTRDGQTLWAINAPSSMFVHSAANVPTMCLSESAAQNLPNGIESWFQSRLPSKTHLHQHSLLCN